MGQYQQLEERTIRNQLFLLTVQRKVSEFVALHLLQTLLTKSLNSCFCHIQAECCTEFGQQQASRRLLLFSPGGEGFFKRCNKSKRNNNPFCMHTSTRTKYSNERFTTPPFKCHTQFIAGSE